MNKRKIYSLIVIFVFSFVCINKTHALEADIDGTLFDLKSNNINPGLIIESSLIYGQNGNIDQIGDKIYLVDSSAYNVLNNTELKDNIIKINISSNNYQNEINSYFTNKTNMEGYLKKATGYDDYKDVLRDENTDTLGYRILYSPAKIYTNTGSKTHRISSIKVAAYLNDISRFNDYDKSLTLTKNDIGLEKQSNCKNNSNQLLQDMKIACGYSLVKVNDTYVDKNCYEWSVEGQELKCTNYDLNNTATYEEKRTQKNTCTNKKNTSKYGIQLGSTSSTTCRIYCKEKAQISLPGNVSDPKQRGTYFAWPTTSDINGLYSLKIKTIHECKIIDDSGKNSNKISPMIVGKCPAGTQSYDINTCRSNSTKKKKCPTLVTKEIDGKCVARTSSSSNSTSKKCPSGTTEISGKCYATSTDKICSNGTRVGDACYHLTGKSPKQNFNKVCPNGYGKNPYYTTYGTSSWDCLQVSINYLANSATVNQFVRDASQWCPAITNGTLALRNQTEATNTILYFQRYGICKYIYCENGKLTYTGKSGIYNQYTCNLGKQTYSYPCSKIETKTGHTAESCTKWGGHGTFGTTSGGVFTCKKTTSVGSCTGTHVATINPSIVDRFATGWPHSSMQDVCPAGTVNSNGSCCPAGTSESNGACCPGGYSYNAGVNPNYCSAYAGTPTCPSGYFEYNGRCYKDAVEKQCPGGYVYDSSESYERFQCKKEVEKVCPNGYTDISGTCYRMQDKTYEASCREGYKLSDDKRSCIKQCDKVALKESIDSKLKETNKISAHLKAVSADVDLVVDTEKTDVEDIGDNTVRLTKTTTLKLPSNLNRYYNRVTDAVSNSGAPSSVIYDRKEGVISIDKNLEITKDNNPIEYGLELLNIKVGTDNKFGKFISNYKCTYEITDRDSCRCPLGTKNEGDDVRELASKMCLNTNSCSNSCAELQSKVCNYDPSDGSSNKVCNSNKFYCLNTTDKSNIDITECVKNKMNDTTLLTAIRECSLEKSECANNYCINAKTKNREYIKDCLDAGNTRLACEYRAGCSLNSCSSNYCSGSCNWLYKTIRKVTYGIQKCNGHNCNFETYCTDNDKKVSKSSVSCVEKKIGTTNILDYLNSNSFNESALEGAIRACESTICEIGPNVLYRTIDLQNPFPGTNGNERTPGYNWNSNGYLKSKLKEARNTNNVYTKEPLMTITLSSDSIKMLRDYNNSKGNSYNDFNMKCLKNNSSACISTLLRDGDLNVRFSSKCDLNASSTDEDYEACYNSNK